MRILCHAQHLTGVGHFVRMHLLASALADAHEVHLVDGGRAVPRPGGPRGLHRLPLPPLCRGGDGRLLSVDGGSSEPVLRERARLLAERTREIRPDAVLIDHYPFSKWELEAEIAAMVAAARDVNSSVRVLCSLRDIAPRTQYEAVDADRYAVCVLDNLADRFDGVLVHSDAAFTRLDDHFAAASAIPVPVRYTGFVTEPAAAFSTSPPRSDRRAVLSAGGIEATEFLVAGIRAFLASAVEPMGLDVFLSPGATNDDRAALMKVAGHDRVDVHEFSPTFNAHLQRAVVSISRSGYNTTAALLRFRVPAVVVPDPRLSDQEERARILAQHGLAVAVPSSRQFDPDVLARAIASAVGSPPRPHTFDLDGAAATRRILEARSA